MLVASQIKIIGPGAISYAGDGVLERVAERRVANGWGVSHIEPGDILVAPADCGMLGKRGYLVTQGKVIPATVVDCEADVHSGRMKQDGLLLDSNQEELTHSTGWLILTN